MPFRILISASSSFNDGQLFEDTLDFMLSNRPGAELHYLTQKVFIKMCNDYAKANSFISKVQQRDFNWEGRETTRECYKRVLQLIPDAAIVFWDGETFNERWLIGQLQEQNIKHKVVYFESFKQQAEKAKELKKLEPKKKKHPAIRLTKEEKEFYISAHFEWHKQRYGKDHEFLYFVPKTPTINSASALQTFGENIFKWKGHHLERTANAGVMRNGKWTKGMGMNGTTDDKGHFCKPARDFAIPIYAEVKFGKDKMSEKQLWYAEKVISTGAVHTVIKYAGDWIDFYNYLNAL